MKDLFYPERRIRAFGARTGVPVLTLAPEMQRRVDATGAVLHGFGESAGRGHWNEKGHRMAAELIAR